MYIPKLWRSSDWIHSNHPTSGYSIITFTYLLTYIISFAFYNCKCVVDDVRIIDRLLLCLSEWCQQWKGGCVRACVRVCVWARARALIGRWDTWRSWEWWYCSACQLRWKYFIRNQIGLCVQSVCSVPVENYVDRCQCGSQERSFSAPKLMIRNSTLCDD